MDKDIVVNEKFDFLMLNIAKECGDINNLMEHFFSFLLRKTDFITNSNNIDECENVILKTLRKYYKKKDEYLMKLKNEYKKMDEEKKKQYEKKKQQEENEQNNKGQQKIIDNNKKDKHTKTIETNTSNRNSYNQVNKIINNNNQRVIDLDEENDMNENVIEMINQNKNNSNDSLNHINQNKHLHDEKKDQDNDDDDDDAEPPKGNGGKTDKYVWTQSINTLDMYIDTKDNIKTKDIKIDITYKKLYVKVKNQVLIDGEFFKQIKPEESIWTLEDNKIIHIFIEKLNGMEWWNTVIKGDAEIDVKKIVPENSRMEDLDAETRSVVEKMIYDQKQKAMNLPTSDEQKKYEIFEKFKQMHPEMDFSKANINYGNSSSSNNMFFGR
ncbi:nuclear movement protein, putative [Plasmodium gaboni]|uniref:Nuclear migration protein nudC n=1 Tax=Plasmodium gaboni TaxID=647221 RepID=A0ABY1USS7_9APIC|nr:nuclear movement protein, putative [Plasmodium gaboni]